MTPQNLYDLSFAVKPTSDEQDPRLYPYQKAACEQYATRRHVLLGHHPGAGKTPMGIQALKAAWLRKEPAIVVCPPNLVRQWRDKLMTWMPGYEGVGVSVIPDSMIHHQRSAFRYGGTIVIDECHRFKSRQSRRTRALFGGKYKDTKFPGITTGAKHIIALTGTPVISSPIDLFPLLRAMGFEDAKTFTGFCDKYCPPYQAPVYGGHMEWRYDKPKDLDVLRRKLRETVLIRPKREEYLAQLPNLTFDTHYVDIPDPSDEYSVDEIATAFAAPMEGDVPLSILRKEVGMRKARESIGFLTDLIEGGEKPLIWCWHREVADTIAAQIPGALSVHGGHDVGVRIDKIDQFVQGAAPALVLSIASMGTGFDGLQHASSLCVFVERSFNPSDNEQAIARVHRTGQINPVRVLNIESQTVIDFVIESANTRKTHTATEALK